MSANHYSKARGRLAVATAAVRFLQALAQLADLWVKVFHP
jgi:hypothetical protein